MIASKKIGRLTLLKHCIIFAGVILSIPVIIELIDNKPINIIRAVKEAFKLNSLDRYDAICLIIHLTVLLIGIWFFGGKAGRLIIDQKKSKLIIGFMTIFKLWILHFISATILQVIANDLPLIGWFISGLLLILLVGLIHGLVAGYFLTKEIKRKGQLIKKTHASTM